MNNIKSSKRYNLKISFIHSIKYLFTSLLIIYISFIFLNHFLEEYLPINLYEYKYWLIIIFIIFYLIRFLTTFLSIKTSLDTLSEIDSIRDTSNKNEVIQYLNQMYRIYEQKVDESKTKLELLKSFSPIPLVIFIFTLVQDNAFSLVASIKKINDFSLLVSSEIYTMGVIAFIIWYIISIQITYNKFNTLSKIKTKYLIALEKEQSL